MSFFFFFSPVSGQRAHLAAPRVLEAISAGTSEAPAACAGGGGQCTEHTEGSPPWHGGHPGAQHHTRMPHGHLAPAHTPAARPHATKLLRLAQAPTTHGAAPVAPQPPTPQTYRWGESGSKQVLPTSAACGSQQSPSSKSSSMLLHSMWQTPSRRFQEKQRPGRRQSPPS